MGESRADVRHELSQYRLIRLEPPSAGRATAAPRQASQSLAARAMGARPRTTSMAQPRSQCSRLLRLQYERGLPRICVARDVAFDRRRSHIRPVNCAHVTAARAARRMVSGSAGRESLVVPRPGSRDSSDFFASFVSVDARRPRSTAAAGEDEDRRVLREDGEHAGRHRAARAACGRRRRTRRRLAAAGGRSVRVVALRSRDRHASSARVRQRGAARAHDWPSSRTAASGRPPSKLGHGHRVVIGARVARPSTSSHASRTISRSASSPRPARCGGPPRRGRVPARRRRPCVEREGAAKRVKLGAAQGQPSFFFHTSSRPTRDSSAAADALFAASTSERMPLNDRRSSSRPPRARRRRHVAPRSSRLSAPTRRRAPRRSR